MIFTAVFSWFLIDKRPHTKLAVKELILDGVVARCRDCTHEHHLSNEPFAFCRSVWRFFARGQQETCSLLRYIKPLLVNVDLIRHVLEFVLIVWVQHLLTKSETLNLVFICYERLDFSVVSLNPAILDGVMDS